MRVIGADHIEVVLDVGAEVAEGPLWDSTSNELLWVDIPRCLVHWFRPVDGRVESFDAGQSVGAVAVRAAGGLMLAMRDGFGRLDRHSGHLELACVVEKDRSDNRMNDGKCDSAGRFWAGTMALDMSPGAGALYRLGTDLRAVRVLQPVSVSNGLGWSPDDRTMYFVDSLTGGVDAFEYRADSGSIDNRRRLIDVAPDDGLPDGMVVDAEGFLWLAVWGGWSVRRYAPDGALDLVVELPTAQITSCAFGGEAMDELYITSAAHGLSARERREQPHAGAIFRVRPGVQGMPAQRFAG
ncbi:MAG: SMP-30/gluconolactonase/LRE family protein [Nocardioidaceae bacterium]